MNDPQPNPSDDPIYDDEDVEENDNDFARCRCVDCGGTFLTRCNRTRCARCFLGAAQDKGYWQDEAERLARTEAQRLLASPAIAAARAHIRATLRAWEAAPIWREI